MGLVEGFLVAVIIQERLPSVDVKIVEGGDIKKVNTDDFFGDGKIVLFGLPGAFTPTCSQSHLPGYLALANEIMAQNVKK